MDNHSDPTDSKVKKEEVDQEEAVTKDFKEARKRKRKEQEERMNASHKKNKLLMDSEVKKEVKEEPMEEETAIQPQQEESDPIIKEEPTDEVFPSKEFQEDEPHVSITESKLIDVMEQETSRNQELNEQPEMLELDNEIHRLELENIQLLSRLNEHIRRENEIEKVNTSEMSSHAGFSDSNDAQNDNGFDFGMEDNVLSDVEDRPSIRVEKSKKSPNNTEDAFPELSGDEQLLRCKKCGRNFTNKADLYKHLQIHGGAFPCEICDKMFFSKLVLDNHIMMHAGPSEKKPLSSKKKDKKSK